MQPPIGYKGHQRDGDSGCTCTPSLTPPPNMTEIPRHVRKAAVAPDGTIYVLDNPYYTPWSGLIALWGDSPPLTEGWPTEGSGMGRLRRESPH